MARGTRIRRWAVTGPCLAMAAAVSVSTRGLAVAGFSTTATQLSSRNTLSFHREPPSRRTTATRSFVKNSSGNDSGDCGCGDDRLLGADAAKVPLLVGKNESTDGLGALLRKTQLTNIDGKRVALGSYIASPNNNKNNEEDATVVVFLRHLA